MQTDAYREAPEEELRKSSQESIERARDLVNGLKTVQEHEAALMDSRPPPLLLPEGNS